MPIAQNHAANVLVAGNVIPYSGGYSMLVVFRTVLHVLLSSPVWFKFSLSTRHFSIKVHLSTVNQFASYINVLFVVKRG